MESIDIPIIKIPVDMRFHHGRWTLPDRGVDTAIYLVESSIEHNVPITSYEEMVMILKYLKKHRALLDMLEY